MPTLTVTGRSVLSRNVKQGTPRTVVSSWMPPESVIMTAAPRTSVAAAESRDGLGAGFFLLLREAFSRFFTEYYLIPVGIIFIAMVIFVPQGLLGFLRRTLNR